MDLKRLEHYREYFNKQKGRKYPCSNQIVRCAIVTNDNRYPNCRERIILLGKNYIK